MTPRTISKETFCYVFAVDGEHPICYHTLWKTYIKPYLPQLGITAQDYKQARKGLPYHIAWRIIELHRISSEELREALNRSTQRKQRRRRIRRIEASQEIPFPRE
jgi:hypothetical protein